MPQTLPTAEKPMRKAWRRMTHDDGPRRTQVTLPLARCRQPAWLVLPVLLDLAEPARPDLPQRARSSNSPQEGQDVDNNLFLITIYIS